jgi:thiamine pyrophosphokinase
MKKKEKFFIDGLQSTSIASFIGPLFSLPFILPPTDSSFIFVDGGCHFFTEVKNSYLRSFPTFNFLKVGDQDSYKGELDVVLEKTKNFSDLAYAFSLLPKNIEYISLQGFLGGRKDHELFNLGEAHHFLASEQSHPNGSLSFENSFKAFSSGTHQINYQGPFSLFVLEQTSLQMIGDVMFPLPSPTPLKALSSHGLSNIGQGSFNIISEKPFFLYFPEEL